MGNGALTSQGCPRPGMSWLGFESLGVDQTSGEFHVLDCARMKQAVVVDFVEPFHIVQHIPELLLMPCEIVVGEFQSGQRGNFSNVVGCEFTHGRFI